MSNNKPLLTVTGIHMLGLGTWGDAGWTKEPPQDCHPNSGLSLCQFLYALRSLVHTSYAVCMITAPAHLFQVLLYHMLIDYYQSCHN